MQPKLMACFCLKLPTVCNRLEDLIQLLRHLSDCIIDKSLSLLLWAAPEFTHLWTAAMNTHHGGLFWHPEV
jgi:hypothetical protein